MCIHDIHLLYMYCLRTKNVVERVIRDQFLFIYGRCQKLLILDLAAVVGIEPLQQRLHGLWGGFQAQLGDCFLEVVCVDGALVALVLRCEMRENNRLYLSITDEHNCTTTLVTPWTMGTTACKQHHMRVRTSVLNISRS